MGNRERIKNIEELNMRLLGEDKKVMTEGSDYTSNLGRADNEKVGKIIEALPENVVSAIGNMTDKIGEGLKGMEGMGDIDPSTRDIAVAIGSIAYTRMG